MKIDNISIKSVQGSRETNEDRFINTKIGDLLVIGVFDGHGGSKSVQLAVDELIPTLTYCLENESNLSEAIIKTFQILNDKMHELNYQDGTTATVALIKKSMMLIAHVGDSRAAVIRSDNLRTLTKDHKITDPEEMTRYRSSRWFKEKSGLISKGLVKGFKLIAVSRSLGDIFFEDAVSPIPDVCNFVLKKNDLFILATDGLWNFTRSDEIISSAANIKVGVCLSDIFIQIALKNKSADNITVGVITI